MAWRPAHAHQPKRGHRVGTDAALLVAAAGDARQGRIVDVGAGVGAVGLALAERNPLPPSILSRSIPIWRGLPNTTRRATGFRRAHASCGSTRSIRRSAARRGSTEQASCVVTNPPFFDARAVRASPDEGKARAHVLAGAEAGASLADWIQASLAILAPGGRFVMIHRPDALSVILAGIGGRLGALALLPVHPTNRRERASAARLGREGVKSAAAPRAGAGPARDRRPTDRGGGRHPSRRAAYRLGPDRIAGLVHPYFDCKISGQVISLLQG